MYPSQKFLGRQTYLLWFSFKCYVTPTVYELVWPQGLFGWPPDHMGWFALLLLVKFKTPGWFYFISYSYQVVHFGGWEHCVKVWWVTRSKSKVSRLLFSLVLVARDMICFVVKSENFMKKGLWSRLIIPWPLANPFSCSLFLHSQPLRIFSWFNHEQKDDLHCSKTAKNNWPCTTQF